MSVASLSLFFSLSWVCAATHCLAHAPLQALMREIDQDKAAQEALTVSDDSEAEQEVEGEGEGEPMSAAQIRVSPVSSLAFPHVI
jgi:hypothetical protein